jgi:hypothetical protein
VLLHVQPVYLISAEYSLKPWSMYVVRRVGCVMVGVGDVGDGANNDWKKVAF